jgi:putative transposase
LVSLSRSVYAYQKQQKDDHELIASLNGLVERHPAIGFWKRYYRLRRKGHTCNHKRLYRIYTMPSGSISGENPSGDYLRE